MITKGTKVVHPEHGTCTYISTPMCRQKDGQEMARVKLANGDIKGVLLNELTELTTPVESSVESFFDVKKMRKFLEQAVNHYAKGPGWFTDWLDNLYIRLGEDWHGITLDEICTVARLHDADGWKPEPFAVNDAYKLFDRLKRDTSGILGY